MDPIAQALMSGQAAGAQRPDLNDPVVRAMLGMGAPNAMPQDPTQLAMMSGQAAQAQFPDPHAQEFAHVREQANQQMTPFTPSQAGQPGDQSWSEWANDPSFNDGRGRYGLVPSAIRGAGKIYDALPEMPNIPGAQYVGRSLEALGRAPGDIAEMSPGEMVQGIGDAAAAFGGPGNPTGVVGALMQMRRYPEATKGAVTGNWGHVTGPANRRTHQIRNAKPHEIQKRTPGGQFQKFDKETRTLREQAKRDREILRNRSGGGGGLLP